jgi:hypothetical protein
MKFQQASHAKSKTALQAVYLRNDLKNRFTVAGASCLLWRLTGQTEILSIL